MSLSVLRLQAVKSRTGLARSTIYKYMQQGCFPRSIQLGKKAVGWRSNDIDEWIESRIHTSSKQGA